jgi:hypothetical protein
MTEILLNMEPMSASCEDTILVISPNIQLVEDVRGFCVQRNMNLWIGDPNSPDLIAVPYKVGIVDKYCMDRKSWTDWLEFLRETKGCSHDHLLIIILPAPFSEAALIEIKREFEDAHEPVSFIFGANGGQVVEIMNNWLNTRPIEPSGSVPNDETSTIVPAVSGRASQMTFRDRLDELTNRFTFTDTKSKVNLDVFFKFRIQAKWLLAKYLGENHLYTKELNTTVAVDMDPYAVGSYLLAAKGVLEALAEDMDRGLIELKEET